MIPHLYTALLPFYTENGGNATRILYADGSFEVYEKPIKSCMYQLLQGAHLDPSTLKYWTEQILDAKANTPLILTDTCIFLPLKARHPVSKNDGCFGYIQQSHIKAYKNGVITFHNNTVLETLSSDSYIAKKERDAKLLAFSYIEQKKQYEFMLMDTKNKPAYF